MIQSPVRKVRIFYEATDSSVQKRHLLDWNCVCLGEMRKCRELFYQGVRLKEVFVKIVDCTHLFLMVQHRHFDLPKCRLIISSLPS